QKDYSKLVKKVIVDKKGHTKTVWVRLIKDEKISKEEREILDFIDRNSGEKLKNFYKNVLAQNTEKVTENVINKAIEKKEGLDFFYLLIFPRIIDRVDENIINKVIDREEDLFCFYEHVLSQIPDKVDKDIINKAIEKGDGIYAFYWFVLSQIPDKVDKDIINKAIDKWEGLGGFYVYVLPQILDKVDENVISKIMSEEKDTDDFYRYVFSKIDNKIIKKLHTKELDLKDMLELREHNSKYESLSYLYSKYKDRKQVLVKELFNNKLQGLYNQNEQEFKKNNILVNTKEGKAIDINKLKEYVEKNKDIKEKEEKRYNFSTIKTWKGLQRVTQKGNKNSKKQKVITLQLEEFPEDEQKRELLKKIFKLEFNREHPVFANSLGWIRFADIKEKDGSKSMLIDEVQSDIIDNERLNRRVKEEKITVEDVKKIREEFSGWHNYLYSKLLQIAKNNNYKNIYIHTAETLQQKGGTTSNTRYKELYEQFAKQNGFVKVNVEDLNLYSIDNRRNITGEMWKREVNEFSKSKKGVELMNLIKSQQKMPIGIIHKTPSGKLVKKVAEGKWIEVKDIKTSGKTGYRATSRDMGTVGKVGAQTKTADGLDLKEVSKYKGKKLRVKGHGKDAVSTKYHGIVGEFTGEFNAEGKPKLKIWDKIKNAFTMIAVPAFVLELAKSEFVLLGFNNNAILVKASEDIKELQALYDYEEMTKKYIEQENLVLIKAKNNFKYLKKISIGNGKIKYILKSNNIENKENQLSSKYKLNDKEAEELKNIRSKIKDLNEIDIKRIQQNEKEFANFILDNDNFFNEIAVRNKINYEDIEDVKQEMKLKVWLEMKNPDFKIEKKDLETIGETFTTWINNIANDIVINFKKSKDKYLDNFEELEDKSKNDLKETEEVKKNLSQNIKDIYDKIINKLDINEKRVLNCYLLGDKPKEIAERLKIKQTEVSLILSKIKNLFNETAKKVAFIKSFLVEDIEFLNNYFDLNIRLPLLFKSDVDYLYLWNGKVWKLLIKSKKVPIGTIAEWKGQKMQKVANGKWVPVSDNKQKVEKKEEKKNEPKFTEKQKGKIKNFMKKFLEFLGDIWTSQDVGIGKIAEAITELDKKAIENQKKKELEKKAIENKKRNELEKKENIQTKKIKE
ncbi:MAG: sigma-70 family RNA polymerase sigma factor, partial [Endomicrobiia bacterium]